MSHQIDLRIHPLDTPFVWSRNENSNSQRKPGTTQVHTTLVNWLVKWKWNWPLCSKRKRSEDVGSVDDASCSQPPSPVTSNSHPSPPCVTPDRTPVNYPTAAATTTFHHHTRSISPSENQVRLPPLKHLLQAIPHSFTGNDSYYPLREPAPTAYHWPTPVAPHIGRSSTYYVGDPWKKKSNQTPKRSNQLTQIIRKEGWQSPPLLSPPSPSPILNTL